MDAKALFYKALDHAGDPMTRLRPDDYHMATPDTEWDVRTLANHMLYELCWVPDLVEGRTIQQVGDAFGGDLLGDNASENWQNAVDRARESVAECSLDDMAHLSYGDVRNSDYLRQVGGDLLIHGWDLAKALGMPYRMDPELAQTIYDGLYRTKSSLQESGLFGKEIIVDDDADVQTKLLALTGRDAGWQPGTTV